MRKALCSMIAVLGTLTLAAPAHAGAVPPCAYFNNASRLIYTDHPMDFPNTPLPVSPQIPQSRLTVEGTLYFNAPSCSNVRYSIVALDDLVNIVTVGSQSQVGDGHSTADGLGVMNFAFPADLGTPQTSGGLSVCLVVQAQSTETGTIYDRVPQTGCVSFALNAPPSWSFH